MATPGGSPFPDPKERATAILIVEDERFVRAITADYFQQSGFLVFEARNGAEALGILEGGGAKIELVFSDIQMPGEMDGLDLAHWIKTYRPEIQTLLTSGHAEKSTIAKGLYGTQFFFEKPYELADVVARIRSLIDAKRRMKDRS